MTDSVLDSVKETLGIPVDQMAFDAELMIYINSVLSTLRQLGVGPADGFMITGNSETWNAFLGDPVPAKFNDVKTYISFRVKLMFDIPATSFAIDAIKQQIQELEWRLNVTREETDWVDPNPIVSWQ